MSVAYERESLFITCVSCTVWFRCNSAPHHFLTGSPNDRNPILSITCLCERGKRVHSEVRSGSSGFYLEVISIHLLTFYWPWKLYGHAIVEKVGYIVFLYRRVLGIGEQWYCTSIPDGDGDRYCISEWYKHKYLEKGAGKLRRREVGWMLE